MSTTPTEATMIAISLRELTEDEQVLLSFFHDHPWLHSDTEIKQTKLLTDEQRAALPELYRLGYLETVPLEYDDLPTRAYRISCSGMLAYYAHACRGVRCEGISVWLHRYRAAPEISSISVIGKTE